MNKTTIHSLNTKITLAFITIGFILLAILFIQILPRLTTEQKVQKEHQIEHMLLLTKNQIKFAVELLLNHRKERINEISLWFNEYTSEATERLNIKPLGQNHILEQLKEQTSCDAYILNSLNQTMTKTALFDLDEEKKRQLQHNNLIFFTDNQRHMCPQQTRSILYQRPLENNSHLVLECNPIMFREKAEHGSLESRIKEDLQKSFQLTYDDHKGKINLLWINTKHQYYANQPLYHPNDKSFNEKYCLSKMSSANNPQTGRLSAKQIVQAANNKPLRHTIYIDNDLHQPKEALTWVKGLKEKGDKKFYFLMTVYEEDFNKNLYDPLLRIMPAGVFALITAILLGFLIFRRMFKSIGILTHTVKEVNNGNRSIRNNLKGNDDIALLAQSFDHMMDSIEANISQLDANVALKTKQLQNSLKEKETLLKEIHHRVKNNLAMTINLIKLQKTKIQDKQSQEILTDIQERIFTMELLHRRLYESKDLNSIEMTKYIEELIQDLCQTYQMDKTIETKLDIDALQMHIEYALPCGLIITECVINSLKYAFEQSDTGTIGIKLFLKNDSVYLHIFDTGVGLPSTLDIYKSKTLGLRIITSIAKNQLQGDIEYSFQNGAHFEITFNMNDVP